MRTAVTDFVVICIHPQNRMSTQRIVYIAAGSTFYLASALLLRNRSVATGCMKVVAAAM